MRIAEGQMDIGPPHFGAIADTVYLQHTGKATAYALGHVGYQFTHETMDGALFRSVTGPLDLDPAIADFDDVPGRNSGLQFALGTLDGEHAVGQNRFDALVENHGHSSYARHFFTDPFVISAR